MKSGLSLVDLAGKIQAQSAEKKDYLADTRDILLVVDNDKPKLELANQGQFDVRPVAHDQIGAYTGIPSRYYDRMLAEAPKLLADSVNTWLGKHKPERRMVRTLKNSGARAFLSDKFQRIENFEMAEVALKVLADFPQVKIVSSEVTERKMYIQFVVPTIEGEVKRGDVVQVGGVVSNSEIGLGAASVSGLLWRLVCLNGMKTSDVYRKTHVGRRIEGDEIAWSEETVRSDDATVLLKVRDMVRAVVDETRFRANLAKLSELTEPKITGDPARVIEVLANKVGASEAEQGGILRSLIEGGDLSAWGLLNAVTAQAHTVESYDRAVEFEEAGGKLLNLAPAEWTEMLAAA